MTKKYRKTKTWSGKHVQHNHNEIDIKKNKIISYNKILQSFELDRQLFNM